MRRAPTSRVRRRDGEPREAFGPIPRNVGTVLHESRAFVEVLICADDLKFSGSSGSSGSGAAKILICLAISIAPVRNHYISAVVPVVPGMGTAAGRNHWNHCLVGSGSGCRFA